MEQRKIAREEEQAALEESHGPGIIPDKKVSTSRWMYDRKVMEELRAFNARVQSAVKSQSFNGTDRNISLESIDRQTYATECDYTPNSNKSEESRSWMKKMQSKFKCCGPRGYDDWKNYVYDVNTTCVDSKTNTTYLGGCALPFNKYLAARLHTTVGFIFALSVVFLLKIFAACLHFAVMKFEDKGIIIKYSLLDMSEPEDYQVVETHHQVSTKGLLGSDPVRGILQASSIRAERSRRSTIAASFNPRLAFGAVNTHGGQVKNLSHTLMAFNKATTKEKDEKGKGHVTHAVQKLSSHNIHAKKQ